MSALQQGSNHYCIASPNFSDSAFQVQMTIVQGDAGGIGFRSDSTKGKGYLFVISQDGKYGLYVFTNASPFLIRSGSNTAINTGLNQSNIVAVVANGSTIDLYVNNQKIESVNDSTYSQGQIGVSAVELNNPTEVVFSNAKVWT